MKKDILITLLIAALFTMCFLLTGCSSDTQNSNPTTSDNKTQKQAEEVSKEAIGLSETIYNQSQNTIESSNLTSEAQKAFNSQYTAYEGNQKGTNVKGLINTIKNHNNIDKDNCLYIIFKGKTYSGNDVASIKDLINVSDTYNITMNYGGNGYIEGISIN